MSKRKKTTRKTTKKSGKTFGVERSLLIAQRLMGIFLLAVMVLVLGVWLRNQLLPPTPPAVGERTSANEGVRSGERAYRRGGAPKYKFYDDLRKREAEVQGEAPRQSQNDSPVPTLTLESLQTAAPSAEERAVSPSPSGASGRRYRIQIGSYADRDAADRLRANMILQDYPAELATIGNMIVVQIGPYGDRGEAERIQERLRGEGFSDSILKSYTD